MKVYISETSVRNVKNRNILTACRKQNKTKKQQTTSNTNLPWGSADVELDKILNILICLIINEMVPGGWHHGTAG